MQDAQACAEAAKEEIRRSFSMQRLLAAVEETGQSRIDLLFKRLFERVLAAFYAQGVDPPVALLEVLRHLFDWNEAHVEYLPWWMTAGGRARRESLRQRLLRLPGDVRSDWIIDDRLVASAARVMLPIKAGLERQAVGLLTLLDGGPLDQVLHCVDDFVQWRADNLGPVAFTPPTFTEIMSPAAATGTPAGNADWAHDWERPRRRFLVLDEWTELLPTDGVHVESGAQCVRCG